MRKEIDTYRKEQKNQERVNVGFQREIQNVINQIKKLNNFTYQGQRVSEETHNQILALKAKHETDKLNFETKIMDLQHKLSERDDTELERTRSKGMNKHLEQDSVEFLNPAALLKVILHKWLVNNKEKKNLMDMYVRNVKIIEDAFD